MRSLFTSFTDSAKELTQTRNMVLCGLMGALAIVLSYTTSIYITPNIRIGFSNLPNISVDYLMGPVVGLIFGGAMDIIKYFVKPNGGSFFPGYTLTAMVSGLIYGILLYKKPIKLWRVLLSEVLVKLICNCGLNTLWLTITGGEAFMVLLPARFIKNLVFIPIDALTALFVITLVRQVALRTDFIEHTNVHNNRVR